MMSWVGSGIYFHGFGWVGSKKFVKLGWISKNDPRPTLNAGIKWTIWRKQQRPTNTKRC